ncbi:MAG TPA: hypothetical protein VFS20_10075 [Longimicrobium sp.]|nr:hypothetical protein [Longimicrobium sp.]
MSQSTPCPSRYRWFDMVRMSGAEGRRWVAEYARVQPLVTQVLAPLEVLRKGDLATGGEMLERASEALQGTCFEHASLRAMVERWYLGVEGYAHYTRNEYDQADACMRGAVERLGDALAEHAFLMPMADDAFMLVLQRARIARNRRRWAEMWEHLDTCAALRDDRRPYAALAGGTPLMLSIMVDWFGALPAPAHAQPLVPHLQDAYERRLNTEFTLREVVRLSGFAIPHP